MAAYPRLLIALCAAFACLTAETAQADCCAGHRASYLVGYGGHVGPSHATPFAGTINPRYANPQYAAAPSIGGPIALPGPTDFLVRQAALEQAALYDEPLDSTGEQLQYASDVELMDSPASEQADSPDSAAEGWSPEYPGQQPPDHVAAQQTPRVADASPARTPQRRTATNRRTAQRTSTKNVGAFASPAAMRLARSLNGAGLGG